MAVIMPANVYGVFEREAVPDPAGTGNNSVLSWSVEESASTMVTATAGAAKNSPRRRHKRLASAGDTSWGSAGAVAIAFVAACLLLVVLAVRQMRTLRGPQSVRLAFAPPALSDPKHVKDAVALLKAATAASSSASASASPTTGTAATTPEKVTPASSSNVAKASNLTPPSGVMKLEGYIKKRSGGGENARWEVWDGTTVLHPAYGQAAPCRWAVYHPPTSVRQQLLHKKPPGSGRMCLYPDVQDRFVSKTIAEKGHWEDCDDLTDSLRGVDKSRAAVYVDIGTNIGACVMQVLLTTDASVVAFEPSPPNLFRLTSTLLDLPRHVRDRVALFPVALGEATGTVSIMANPSNSGNTQVRRSDGETGVDGASQETRDIPVERIDDLLSPKLQIDLVK